jgi:hypothetical protein
MPTYPIRGRMVHVIDESTNTFAGHPLRVISFYSMTAVGVVEGVGAGLSRVTRYANRQIRCATAMPTTSLVRCAAPLTLTDLLASRLVKALLPH